MSNGTYTSIYLSDAQEIFPHKPSSMPGKQQQATKKINLIKEHVELFSSPFSFRYINAVFGEHTFYSQCSQYCIWLWGTIRQSNTKFFFYYYFHFIPVHSYQPGLFCSGLFIIFLFASLLWNFRFVVYFKGNLFLVVIAVSVGRIFYILAMVGSIVFGRESKEINNNDIFPVCSLYFMDITIFFIQFLFYTQAYIQIAKSRTRKYVVLTMKSHR